MARYIMPELVVERIDLEDEAIAEMQDGLPGWEPVEAAVDTKTIRVSAGMASDVATSLSRVPDTIFRYAGRSLHRIDPVAATAATGVVTITAVDTAGYTIPEGTQVAGTNPDGDLVGFTLDADAVIASGSSSVADVAVTAAEAGEDGNGVVGFGQALDTLNFLQSVEFTTSTMGGADEEDDETYLNRLREELQLMAPRPILPRDFATFARRIPGVHRAVAIDGLNPAATAFAGNTTNGSATVSSVSSMTGITVGSIITGTGIPANTTVLTASTTSFTMSANATATATGAALTATGSYGNERAVTVVAIDEEGQSVDAATRNAVAADLDARREVNFVVYVSTPTYTTFNVTFTATAWPGFDADAVEEDIIATLEEYLSAAQWGTPPSDDTRSWVNRTTVPRGEIEGVVYRVDGVRTVDSLTINGTTATSYALAGFAPLTTPGTITGTVTPTTN